MTRGTVPAFLQGTRATTLGRVQRQRPSMPPLWLKAARHLALGPRAVVVPCFRVPLLPHGWLRLLLPGCLSWWPWSWSLHAGVSGASPEPLTWGAPRCTPMVQRPAGQDEVLAWVISQCPNLGWFFSSAERSFPLLRVAAGRWGGAAGGHPRHRLPHPLQRGPAGLC